MSRTLEWLIATISGGMAAAGAFALTAQPLAPLAMLSLSFWIAALIIFIAGFCSTLALVDLKRAFLAAPGIAVFSAIFYGLAIWSPALQLGEYSTHLFNYALVQSVPVFIITIILVAVAAVAGTVVNTSVREYDL